VEVIGFLVLKLVGQAAAEVVTTVRLGLLEQATKGTQVLLAVALQRVAVEVARQQQETAKMVVMVLPARQMVQQPYVLLVEVAQVMVLVVREEGVLEIVIMPQQRQEPPILVLAGAGQTAQQEATVRALAAVV